MVTWEDAHSYDDWIDIKEAVSLSRVMCVSAGIEVSNTKDDIVLAASLNNTGRRGGTWRIPRGMIRKVERIGWVEVPQ